MKFYITYVWFSLVIIFLSTKNPKKHDWHEFSSKTDCHFFIVMDLKNLWKFFFLSHTKNQWNIANIYQAA